MAHEQQVRARLRRRRPPFRVAHARRSPTRVTRAWPRLSSWVDPAAPLYLTKGACCTSTAENYQTAVVDVTLGEVIDIVVVQSGLGSEVEVHPLHLHGNKFWVIGSGPLPYPGAVERVPDLNLHDPIAADTFPVRTGRCVRPRAALRRLRSGCVPDSASATLARI